jgi:putative LysE/RhtB family amino acid efflux pump
MDALIIGFGFGFLVAMQLGPMSLFLVRSTLVGGWSVGLACGGGIALSAAASALGGAGGAAPLLTVDALRTVIGVVGAAMLAVLGIRMLRAAVRPETGGSRQEVASPRRAFAVSLAATAANPATIVSWAAVFAALGAAGSGHAVPLLVTGVGLGSLAWMSLLTTGTTIARRAVGRRAIRIADTIAGTGLLVFAAVLAAQSLAL